MSHHILIKLDIDSMSGYIFKDSFLAHSLLHVSEICKEFLVLGLPEDTNVTLIDPKLGMKIELADVATNKRPHTIREWAAADVTLFSCESSLCPNCGSKSFVNPVLFCDRCGENPGRVYEAVHRA